MDLLQRSNILCKSIWSVLSRKFFWIVFLFDIHYLEDLYMVRLDFCILLVFYLLYIASASFTSNDSTGYIILRYPQILHQINFLRFLSLLLAILSRGPFNQLVSAYLANFIFLIQLHIILWLHLLNFIRKN